MKNEEQQEELRKELEAIRTKFAKDEEHLEEKKQALAKATLTQGGNAMLIPVPAGSIVHSSDLTVDKLMARMETEATQGDFSGMDQAQAGAVLKWVVKVGAFNNRLCYKTCCGKKAPRHCSAPDAH